ncbi:MAG: ERCC4 domain-containing protein [Gammaproteobacteria bacterium]
MAELNKPVRILADSGEKGKIIKKLEALPGVTLDLEPLDLGDYVLGHGVAVERKSATDFILSIVDKSLIDSAAQLKATFDVPVFLVEGDMFEARFHQKAFDVHLALSYMTVMQRIPVLYSRDEETSAALIYCMAADAQHHLGSGVPARINKPAIRPELQQYLLQGLPGIGSFEAEALLTEFDTPARVFAASTEALAQVDGIGPERAARIREVLDKPW